MSVAEEAKPRVKRTLYPIERHAVAGKKPVLVTFDSNTHYGSNDVSRSLENPVSVLARGRVGKCDALSEEWTTILAGIEGRAKKWQERAPGGSDYLKSTVTIRVAPEACPAVIRVIHSDAYQAIDDDGSYSSDSSRRFAVSVTSKRGG